MRKQKRWPRPASISFVLNSAQPCPVGSLNALRFTTNGEPLLCTMPQGALAALAIEDEGAKADLNTAPPRLMSALLRGFGAGSEEADHIAAAITEFSRPATNVALDDITFRAYAAEGRVYGPKKGPFETVLELDQVIGMRFDLLRAVLPYVTVHSRNPGVDPRVAAPELLAALAGLEPAGVAQLVGTQRGGGAREATLRGIPSQFLSPSTGQSFLIRAEVRTPAGGFFVTGGHRRTGGRRDAGRVARMAAWSEPLRHAFQRRSVQAGR